MMTSSLSRQSRLDVVVGLLALATLHCLVARTEAMCTEAQIAQCIKPLTGYDSGSISTERMDTTCRELDTVIPCLTDAGCPMDHSSRTIYQGIIDGFTYLCGPEQTQIFLEGQQCLASSSVKSAFTQCNSTYIAAVQRDPNSYCWLTNQLLACYRRGLQTNCNANFTRVFTMYSIKSTQGVAALVNNCVLDENAINAADQRAGSLLLLAATLIGAAAFLNKRY